MIECDELDLENKFYVTLMHTLSFADLAMNSLAIYCIIYKSTKQMGAYKWYLLIYQIVSAIFDITYTAVTLPVLFFPIPMGYPGGWIAHFIPVDTRTTLTMVTITYSWLGASILNLFNYRRHVVTPTHPIRNFTDRGHIYMSVIIFLVYFIPACFAMYDVLPDQVEARKWVEEQYTCGKPALHLPRVQIFTHSSLLRLALTVFTLATVGLLFAGFCITTSFYFLSRNRSLSPKTRQMQRLFIIYLCIQISIPAATLGLPLVILMLMVTRNSQANQGQGNIVLGVSGLHGCVAGITLIMCNEPYRKFVTRPLIECWKRLVRRKPHIHVRPTEFTRSTNQ
ncbi:hypothetical protein V3C99_010938 [Haemonchus contortus]